MKMQLSRARRGLTALAVAGLGLASALVASATQTDTYFHNDLAGSPVVATNASGQVVWRESYRPYGERLTNSTAASGNQIWFTSRRQDAETGLVYLGARYYDPVAGRFMSMDPKGFNEANVHSFNRYAYANNNPYKFVDTDGRSPLSIFAWEVAKATGVGYGLGVVADAISQKAAFGSVDWGMAATSSSAQAGGEAGLIGGVLSGFGGAWQAVAAKTAGQIGREGEAAVRGAFDIGEKAKIAVNGRTRFPDGLTNDALSEVKNVEKLSFTRQLRDYSDFSQQTGRSFDLYTRPSTQLSGPLQDAIESGLINRLNIPQ